MAQTNILLEAGTNELEVVEFYLEEFTPPLTMRRSWTKTASPFRPSPTVVTTAST